MGMIVHIKTFEHGKPLITELQRDITKRITSV